MRVFVCVELLVHWMVAVALCCKGSLRRADLISEVKVSELEVLGDLEPVVTASPTSKQGLL